MGLTYKCLRCSEIIKAGDVRERGILGRWSVAHVRVSETDPIGEDCGPVQVLKEESVPNCDYCTSKAVYKIADEVDNNLYCYDCISQRLIDEAVFQGWVVDIEEVLYG